MVYEKIQLEFYDSVAVLRLNAPDTLNALTIRMLDEISHAIDKASTSARALVVMGVGKGFCSGASLDPNDPLSAMTDDPMLNDAGLVLEEKINPIMSTLRALPIPWLSAVTGPVAGAGVSLALAADMIFASESAFFLQAFSKLGLVPDAGSTHLITKTVGRVRAMELMLLAERLPAEKALEWGLINYVVPEESLEERVLAVAQQLANGPTKGLAMIREAVWAATDSDWSSLLTSEREMQLIAGKTDDFYEGVKAFQEKRPAVFTGK